MSKCPLNLVGQTFSHLTAIERDPAKTEKNAFWVCRCVCGGKVSVRSMALRNGQAFSCGCIRKERDNGCTTHGQSRSPLYQIWRTMIARCELPSQDSYKYYGGRGISVCPRWRASFEAFAEDMGPRPDGFSLNRIDNDGNYEPGNVEWADKVTQANNTRWNRMVTLRGETMTMAQWARSADLPYDLVAGRIFCGWSEEEALTTPPRLAANEKVSAFGKTMTLSEWSEKTGIDRGTIRNRIEADWTYEDALTRYIHRGLRPLNYRRRA